MGWNSLRHLDSLRDEQHVGQDAGHQAPEKRGRYEEDSEPDVADRVQKELEGLRDPFEEPGARLFGELERNQFKFNVALFDRLNKEKLSALNEFKRREHKVAPRTYVDFAWPDRRAIEVYGAVHFGRFDPDGTRQFLESLGLTEPGLDRLIHSAYRLLHLIT